MYGPMHNYTLNYSPLSRSSFTDALASEILVLDGAMATMIMPLGLDEADFRGELFAGHDVALSGCFELLCLTRPNLIAKIHGQYLDAGARIISTNTFNANSQSLASRHLSGRVGEICRAGAEIARQAVDRDCEEQAISPDRLPFVAGSMGPGPVSLSSAARQSDAEGSRKFDAVATACAEQATALIEGGVDLLLLETVFDTLNAKAASTGIQRAFQRVGKTVPLMVSATLTGQGRLPSGEILEEFIEAMRHSGAVSFGLNCSFGANALSPWVEQLSAISPGFVSVHPNAGLPDLTGRYRETPEQMAAAIAAMLRAGWVNIVGGCCGTTPEHIRLIAAEARRFQPRPSAH